MNCEKILGGLVTIGVLLILIVGSKAHNNAMTLDNVNNLGYLENNLTLDNNSAVSMLEYVNTHNYDIELNTESVNLECLSKNEDVASNVQEDMKLNVLFAKDSDSKKKSSLVLAQDEKAYIYVTARYNGEYPISEVVCEYNINLNVA